MSAETKREAKEEKKGYMRRERSYEKFYSALTLPATVDAGKAKASYKNWVLEVALPKTEVTKKRTVKVE
ncbi:MAG: Hsp20/alpha crystallin family protein [Euryarchaeota archaeon]|nr:Hsp20/alpha crystallin family protein [Euryarchaeota archaeon]